MPLDFCMQYLKTLLKAHGLKVYIVEQNIWGEKRPGGGGGGGDKIKKIALEFFFSTFGKITDGEFVYQQGQ